MYRSLNHIYAQIIDDLQGKTLVSASTLEKDIQAEKGHKGNVTMAKKVGPLIAKRALEKGFRKVVFDRGGYIYHGRVKALADSAREDGPGVLMSCLSSPFGGLRMMITEHCCKEVEWHG